MSLSPFITEHKPLAARSSAATDTYDLPTRGREGVIVIVRVTALTSAGLTVSLLGIAPFTDSAVTYDILDSAHVVAPGVVRLQIHPTMVAVANEVATEQLPAVLRVSVAHDDASSATYQVTSTLTP